MSSNYFFIVILSPDNENSSVTYFQRFSLTSISLISNNKILRHQIEWLLSNKKTIPSFFLWKKYHYEVIALTKFYVKFITFKKIKLCSLSFVLHKEKRIVMFWILLNELWFLLVNWKWLSKNKCNPRYFLIEAT